MGFDYRIRGGGGKLFLDGHAQGDILTVAVQLLTGYKAVECGILGYRADVSRDNHMGQTKSSQSFLTLAVDITFRFRDFYRFGEQVVGPHSVDHDIGRHLIQRRDRADPPPIQPITPGGMILAIRMYFNGKEQHQHTQHHQEIRQQEQACISLTISICHGSHCRQIKKQQQPGVPDASAGNGGVGNAEKQNADAEHTQQKWGIRQQRTEQCCCAKPQQPDGNSGFIKHLLTGQ